MNIILLIVIPLLVAFLSILVKKHQMNLLIIVALFNVIALFFLKPGMIFMGGYEDELTHNVLGITLFLDIYAMIALWVVNGLILIIALINAKSYQGYGTILLLAMAGLNGLVLANDLFNLFVFIEISGIAAYLITTSNKKPVSTFKYLLYGSIGSSLFLFGIVILYAMFGTLNIVIMIREIQILDDYRQLILPFMMMFIGLGVEAKLLPLNNWAKGVLGTSNPLSGPMIASVYMAATTFVFGRLITNLFQFEGSLLLIVTIILTVGILVGDLMAFSSTKVREILLFSSIAQSSIIILLFVNGLVIWAVYLIIANALSKTIMFLVINHSVQITNDDEVSSLKGLFANNLLVGTTFTVASLSVMGLPLFIGFVIKLNYLTAFAEQNQFIVMIVILIASLIEGIYLVRLLIKLWYPGDQKVVVNYHLTFKIVCTIIALSLLVFGTYSNPLSKLDDRIDEISEVVIHG